jgi:hypothetical protein
MSESSNICANLPACRYKGPGKVPDAAASPGVFLINALFWHKLRA